MCECVCIYILAFYLCFPSFFFFIYKNIFFVLWLFRFDFHVPSFVKKQNILFFVFLFLSNVICLLKIHGHRLMLFTHPIIVDHWKVQNEARVVEIKKKYWCIFFFFFFLLFFTWNISTNRISFSLSFLPFSKYFLKDIFIPFFSNHFLFTF